MLYFKDQAWAVKLGHLIEGCDVYQWKFSVMTFPGVDSLPPAPGWEAGKGKELILKERSKLLDNSRVLDQARVILAKMITKFDVCRQLEVVCCSVNDQDIVVQNLIDRLLVMTTEFKAAEGYGIVWETTRNLYKLGGPSPDSLCD